MTVDREFYMRQALELAREAALAGEVPVGCVIVRGDEIVGRGRNRREERQAAASHAEMYPLCHPGALPHVRGGDFERPYPAGVVWGPGCVLRGLRRRGEPLYGGVSQPARPGGGGSGDRVPGRVGRVFRRPQTGTAEVDIKYQEI